MRFNPKARIDQSQYQDVGGRGGGGLGGGGMRLPIPMPGRGGKMGMGTIIVLVLFFVVTQCMGGGGTTTAPNQGSQPQGQTGQGTDECQTGEDANASDKCAIALFTTSVQDYWERTFPEQTDGRYEPIQTKTFTGGVNTGCGQASSQMGPFYCPNDRTVYMDSTFFDDMLEGQLGAKGGPFSIGYVVAHEYGHYVEDLLGLLSRARQQTGPDSDAVKIELMADCLGGMWAADAATTQDAEGNTIIEDLTQDDIRAAIDAAQAVGDDRIQERSGGRVNPEQWTHGSAQQRMDAFMLGYEKQSMQECNFF